MYCGDVPHSFLASVNFDVVHLIGPFLFSLSIIVSASWIHMVIWACVITLSIHHLFTMFLPYLSITVTDKLKERLDFMLRESLTENSYINSLTAHTAYWTSQDCAMYVLLQIYKYKRYEWTGMLQRTCSMCFFCHYQYKCVTKTLKLFVWIIPCNDWAAATNFVHHLVLCKCSYIGLQCTIVLCMGDCASTLILMCPLKSSLLQLMYRVIPQAGQQMNLDLVSRTS